MSDETREDKSPPSDKVVVDDGATVEAATAAAGATEASTAWQHPRFVALVFAAIGFSAAYLGARLSNTPLLYYLPEARAFHLAAEPPRGQIAVGYFGLLLCGLAGAALGYGFGSLPVIRRLFARENLGPTLVVATTAVVFGGLALAAVVELLGF